MCVCGGGGCMLVCVHIYMYIIISTVKMKFTSASKMNKKEENIE